MIFASIVALALVLGVLAVISLAGAALISRAHRPAGNIIEVAGALIHYVELGSHSRIEGNEPPIVLLHGASGNLADMRLALGERLARHHRVILIDRPGHGWSTTGVASDAPSLAAQAVLLGRMLEQLDLRRATLVGHSLSGVLALTLARIAPERVAGLVLLAPVSHPWPGGISWYYTLTTVPVIGPLFAHVLALPLGTLFLPSSLKAVFAPQAPPPDYAAHVGARMVLRPREFIANARDVSQLFDFVTAQSPHYGKIKQPAAILTADADTVVSPQIHSRALADILPRSTLAVLPGAGHMIHHTETDVVIAAVEDVAKRSR